MIFVKLRSSIRFWNNPKTAHTSTANTLSSAASNHATASANFSNTLSSAANNLFSIKQSPYDGFSKLSVAIGQQSFCWNYG